MPPKQYSKKRKATGGGASAKKSKTNRVLFPAGLPASAVTRGKLEMKTLDGNNAGASPYVLNINTAGAVKLMNGCEQGNDINNRVGRKIAMKSIRVTGLIEQSANGTAPLTDYIRLMIVYDRQTNGATFGNSDLLQSKDASGNTSSNVFDGLNPSNYERFVVLRDRRIVLNNYAGLSAPILAPAQDFVQRTNIDEFIPLKGLETHFNAANAGTVADIQMGGLFLFLIGAQSPANGQYSFYGSNRLRFSDK